MRFKDQTVVITGAANGIGRYLAGAYAKEGASVIFGDVDGNQGKETMQAIIQDGHNAWFIPCDVRSEHDIINLAKQATALTGRLDIVINNAGISRWKSPLELSVAEWDDVLNTNVRSAFLLSREAAKHMRAKGQGGSIVNISSTRNRMSEPNSEAYAASKGAILSLTHALAISLGAYGIRVNCISPGWIETGDRSALRDIDHAQHPAGRVGTPEDVKKACFYLTDPENHFVTGTQLVVDGGMTRKMIYEP